MFSHTFFHDFFFHRNRIFSSKTSILATARLRIIFVSIPRLFVSTLFEGTISSRCSGNEPALQQSDRKRVKAEIEHFV